jgi:hypothetical protein
MREIIKTQVSDVSKGKVSEVSDVSEVSEDSRAGYRKFRVPESLVVAKAIIATPDT